MNLLHVSEVVCVINLGRLVSNMLKTTKEPTESTEREDSLTGAIIGAAIEVHCGLGPGLLESAYEACLIYELRLRKLKVEHQKPLPIFYKDVLLVATVLT